MKRVLFDLAITLGGAALILGAVFFLVPHRTGKCEPAPAAVVKAIPGDSATATRRLDVTDGEGRVFLSFYVEGTPKMDVVKGTKRKTLDLARLADKVAPYMMEGE